MTNKKRTRGLFAADSSPYNNQYPDVLSPYGGTSTISNTLTYDPRRSSTYEVDLYEIMTAIKRMPGHGWSHDVRDIEKTLHNLFSDRDFMLKIFTDHRLVSYICDICKDFEKERRRVMEEKASLVQSGGVSHEDYEAAVDIVDEFVEMGLDALDAGQTEVYEENIELIEKYENS